MYNQADGLFGRIWQKLKSRRLFDKPDCGSDGYKMAEPVLQDDYNQK